MLLFKLLLLCLEWLEEVDMLGGFVRKREGRGPGSGVVGGVCRGGSSASAPYLDGTITRQAFLSWIARVVGACWW